MATPAVPNVNLRIYAHIRISTDCDQTTNLSLASLLNGGSFGGIDLTFGSDGNDSGASRFDVIGGSNNPLESTPDTDNLVDDEIGTAPFHMSHTIGGKYT
tara:strand:- start:333 stop:632 length:300 start_codon:yes stop_codon:yes gene_type:complete